MTNTIVKQNLIMYRLNFTKPTLLFLQTVILSATVANPVVGQGLNFVDLNQSRQFFEEGSSKIQGNSRFEHQGESLETNRKLPKIELPKNSYQSSDIDNANNLYRQQTLKLITNNWIENFVD